uniref:Structural protein n=1 Tax=Blencathra virus TaxID=2776961 RepID=A0A8E4VPX2_9VIRU|nr:MAG: structural protein [Blencathra virus]
MAPKSQRQAERVERKAEKKIEKNLKKIVRSEEKKNKMKKTRTVNAGLTSVTYRDNSGAVRRRLARVEKKLQKQKKEFSGPKPQDSMRVSATIGVVTGNSSDTLTRKHKFFLNPLLLKIENSGQTMTPLAERAAMYQLYKIIKFQVRFVPLVNASNVSGSLILVDLDQQGNAAKPESVDTIKARLHKEVAIGRFHTFTPTKKSLAGPRQGWWGMDPNEDADSTFGPAVSVWVYLATKNLLSTNSNQTTNYEGPLFLVEVNVVYTFANYGPKPALALLQNETTEAASDDIQFKTDPDGNLVMSIKNGSTNGKKRHIVNVLNAVNSEHQEQTFWSVATDAVEAVSPFLGSWSWLLKAGWWVIKRIAGQGVSNSNDYFVYASVEDAQRNNPVRAQVQKGNQSIPAGEWHIQQLNCPNVDIYQQGSAVRGLPQNGSRPTGFSPATTPYFAGWNNKGTFEHFDEPTEMMGNTLFLLVGTQIREFPVYQYNVDSDKVFVEGSTSFINLFFREYTTDSSVPTAARRFLTFMKVSGNLLTFGGNSSSDLGLIASLADYKDSNLSGDVLHFLQPVDEKQPKRFQISYNGIRRTEWENSLYALLDLEVGDVLYLGLTRNINLVPNVANIFVKSLLCYNHTKNIVVFVMVGPSFQYIGQPRCQYPLFTAAGVYKNGSLKWDDTELPYVNNVVSALDMQHIEAEYLQEEDDEDDAVSHVSEMFERMEMQDLENEKEYWRKTAQQLMLEKTSRQNTFLPSSSSGR